MRYRPQWDSGETRDGKEDSFGNGEEKLRTLGIEGERKSGVNGWERKGCGNGNYHEYINSAWEHR